MVEDDAVDVDCDDDSVVDLGPVVGSVEGDEDDEYENNDEESKKTENLILKFSEFRIFLQTLRQYYIYCQMFKNNEVDEEKKVTF